jgi:hypothetical protein
LPAVALAKAGRRFGWQAGASLGPQALISIIGRIGHLTGIGRKA